jgi:sugar-specific transcriptional regulator TrmB
MEPSEHIQPLVALGLNAMEAEIYADLLQRSPVTGYGVAKALGKPAANVYKALETLEGKGAVVVDDGKRKHYRAVPIAEFLRRLEREFDRHRRDAKAALARFPEPAEDTRVYQLRSREQVIERFRQMLSEAQEVAFLDIFPLAAEELRPEIMTAAARGIQVVAKTYSEDSTFAGVDAILDPDHEMIRARWPEEWLNLYVDGSEFLVSVLDPDGIGVIQAIWSESPHLAWVFQSSFSHELGFTQLRSAFRGKTSLSGLKKIFQRTGQYLAVEAPGYHRLRQQLDRVQDDDGGKQ